MGAAKIVGLLVLMFVIHDWKLMPVSVSCASPNCTNSSHGGVHCKPVPYGPIPLEQANNETAVGLLALDTNCKQLPPPLSPNATINSTATLSIRAVDPNKLLLPGPAADGSQEQNTCKATNATQATGDKKTCKATNTNATGNKRTCRASCNKAPKPKCGAAGEAGVPRAGVPRAGVPQDECHISDIEETMVMATCASCSARANTNGVGVTLTCFDCHHIPADKTCHYSKYDPKIKVSAKFFELAEYSGRGNVTEPAPTPTPTPTDDKKQQKKK